MNYKTNFTMSMRRGWLAGMRTMMALGTRAMMALGTRAAVVLLLMLLTSTSAWAQTVATVTEGENTTTFKLGNGDGEYATAAAAFEAAVAAANDASTAVTIKLFNDITIGKPEQPAQTPQECNILIGSSLDSNVRNITLDLNGQTLTGYSKNCVIQVNGEKTSVTITDSSSGQNGTICNGSTYISSGVILNYGTLTFEAGIIRNQVTGGIINGDSENIKGELSVKGGTIITGGCAIANYVQGTATISKCTISGEYDDGNNNFGILNSGNMTIGSEVVIKNCVAGIRLSASLTLNALPTFGTGNNANETDISFELNGKIAFGETFQAPATPLDNKIKVKINDGLPALLVFTTGYAAAFTDGETGKTVDLADVFTVDGFTVVLSDGEALAYNNNLVAANTASDGSILYNIGGTVDENTEYYKYFNTEAAAFEAAVEAANAAESDVTLTLYNKDVDLGDNTIEFNNENLIDEGTDEERPVAMTLDLNGQKITGTCASIEIGEDNFIPGYVICANGKLTITDSAEGGGGAIENTNTVSNWERAALKVGSGGDVTVSGGSISGFYGIENKSGGTLTVTGGTISGTGLSETHNNGVGIYNNGVTNEQDEVTAISTLTVTGGAISGTDCGITNYNGAKLTVTGGTIESTGNNAIDNQSTLTIGGGVTVKYPGGFGIDNNSSSTLVLTGLPTFVYTGEENGDDIYQCDVITFADNFTYTKPTRPIKMIGMEKGETFTSGYGAHCVYPEGHAKAGKTVDPNEVFTYGVTKVKNSYVEYEEYVELNAFAELDAKSGEVRFNTPFNVTIALEIPAENETLTQTETLYCGTLKSAIEEVSGYTALVNTDKYKEAGVELTSCIIQPQKDYQISDADKTNSTVEFGNDENAIVATLDLNGHSISGDAKYLITVAENSTLTVAGDGSIVDINYFGCLIENNGTLNITGGTYGNGSWMTNNGTMTVSGGTFTAYGGFVSINNYDGSLTVSGGTFNVYDGGCAINNRSFNGTPVLTLSALPTFVHPEGAMKGTDIDLNENTVITFDKAITAAPTTPIVVRTNNAAPYVFTSGYGANVKSDGKVIDPATVFAITAENTTVVAYESNGATEAAVLAYETVTFPVGQSTYYGDKGLQLVGDNDDLKFYTVTGVSGTTAQLAEITGKTFGKNTPLIVSNTGAEAVEATVLAAATDAMETAFAALCASDLGSAGIFSGFTGTASAINKIGFKDGIEYYGFTGHDFVKIRQDGPVSANRCWLEIGGMSVSATRSITLGWPEGETTGVESMDNGKWIMDNEAGAQWYTVSGQRISKPTRKGIYIRGGKKVVIR